MDRLKQPADFNGANTRNQITQIAKSSMEDILYIHPMDHTNLQLVATPLSGNNFYVWSRAIKRALGARNKLDFINGTLSEPDSDSVYYKAWMKADYLVSTWIMNSLSKDIASAFQYIEDSRRLWVEIENMFSHSSGPKLYQLERELSQCVQNNSSVMNYFNSMNTIWDEINMLNSYPSCRCVICDCGAVEAFRILTEKRKAIQFLLGLNDSFETVRSQILLIEPLPTVSKIYSMVLQDEDQRKAASQSQYVSNTTMYVSNYPHNGNQKFSKLPGDGFRPRLSREEKRKLRCNHCGESGHEIRECFKLHGIPDWFKQLKERRIKDRAMCVTDNVEMTVNSSVEQVLKTEIEKCFLKFSPNMSVDNNGEKINMVQSNSTPFSSMDGYYAFGISTEITNSQWILDSGASVHVCSNVALMKSLHKLKEVLSIYLPNGSVQVVEYYGAVQLTPKLKLNKVLLAPAFTHNIVSVEQLAKEMDIRCTFMDTHCVIQKKFGDTVLGFAKATGKLYVIEYDCADSANNVAEKKNFTAVDWHQMLGHISIIVMEHMPNMKYLCADGMKKHIEACEICYKAKQSRNNFPLKLHRTDNIFELIHIDVWGPYHGHSVTNTPYILTIVEDHSRNTWTFLMSSKLQVYGIIKQFFSMVDTQFGVKIKAVRSDNGSEFVNTNVRDFFVEHGVHHQHTCTYSPQQNGVVERKHRTLLQVARALMFQSCLPMKFWSYSILFATWIINRTPRKLLGWTSPYNVLYHKEVDFNHFTPFGCLVYIKDNAPAKAKFDSRSISCVMLGFDNKHKASILYDLHGERIVISRDTHRFPHIFPFQSQNYELTASCEPLSSPKDSVGVMDSLQPEVLSFPSVSPNLDVVEDGQETEYMDIHSDSEQGSCSIQTIPLQDSDSIAPVDSCVALHRVRRNCKQPAWLSDFVAFSHVDSGILLQQDTKFLTPLTFPFVISSVFTPQFVAFMVNLADIKEPTSYNEACKCLDWISAMDSELEALEKNGTWVLTSLPEGKTAIGSKWVFKVKLQADGSVERFKACLVAKGHNQEYGIDYDEVFSTVTKLVIVRFLFALSASRALDFMNFPPRWALWISTGSILRGGVEGAMMMVHALRADRA